jgi:integrase
MSDHDPREHAKREYQKALAKLAKAFPEAAAGLPEPQSTSSNSTPSTTQRRGHGRVFLRGRIFWIAYYAKRAGRSVEIREPGGRTEKEAQRKLRFRLKQVGAHDLGLEVFKGPKSEKITIEELLDRLERKYEEQGKERRRTHSHMTHLRDLFGVERAMSVAEGGRISDYIRFRQNEQASPGTVNRELRILRRAYHVGVGEKRLNRSSIPTFELLPEHNIREGFVEKGDFEAIMSHLHDVDVRDVVTWAFWSGMRKGEIGKLPWSAFDKETWMLTLPGRITKNGKPRKLALVGIYREIIKRRLTARVIGCDLIFHRNGKPFGSFRKSWVSACKKAGVPDLLFHDLRRTAIRNMVRGGVERTVARTISGHRTEAVFTRYNITDEEDLKDAALKTEAYVSTLPSKSKITSLNQVG